MDPAQQQQQQQQQPPSVQDDPQTRLEQTLLGLFQALTEMQTVAGQVVPGSEGLVASAAERTIASLADLRAQKDSIQGGVPTAVLDLVAEDKHPHAFTRQQLDRASGENQFIKGKVAGIESYAALLDAELAQAFPALAGSLGAASTAQASATAPVAGDGRPTLPSAANIGVGAERQGVEGMDWQA